MGYVSALFARRLADIATAGESSRIASRRDLCRSVGIDPDLPPDPGQYTQFTLLRSARNIKAVGADDSQLANEWRLSS